MLAKETLYNFLNRPPKDKAGNLYGQYTVSQLYLRILPYVKRYWFRSVVAVLITIPIGSLDGLIALSLKPYIDGLQGNTKQLVDLAYIPVLILGFTLVQGGLNYLSIYLNGWIGFHMMSDIRHDLAKKLEHMDLNYFDRNTSGDILTRFYRDPENLQMNLLNNTKQLLTRLFSAIFLSATLLHLSWKLAIAAIAILLFTLVPSRMIRKLIKESAKMETAGASQLASYYNEAYGGVRVIKGFNAGPERLRGFNRIQRHMFDLYMKRIKTQGFLTPAMHIISAFGVALIIWQGSNMVMREELTAGAFTAFVAALIMLYQPIKNLGATMLNSQFSLLAASRIFSLLDEKAHIVNTADAKDMEPLKTGIEFRDVTFSYQKDVVVLDHVNFLIPRGKKVAIVGPSGSGKSTIASLLPRFYDVNVEGGVYVDDVNIKDLKIDSLRSNISIVFQENFLFEGTIRDNLKIGNPRATDEQLWEALEKAYLYEFVKNLEGGLEAKVGERGVLLSGGQRQRLAIARALLKDTPIVILDEATSSLDNQAEAVVHQALEALMEHRTVIIIAHRLSTIRNADLIIVLEHGDVVEQGSHQELMTKGGAYSRLYQASFDAAPINMLPAEDVLNSSLSGTV